MSHGQTRARLIWLLVPLALVAAVGCSGDDDIGASAPAPLDRETTTTAAQPAEPRAGPPQGERLVSALHRGGYVVFFRHTATDRSPDDQHPVDFGDCDTQRNLSDDGRDQARAIGEAFERLDIPVGRVLSSPFCRAIDTAEIAFGRTTPEPAIENLETSADDTEREHRNDGLRRLLSAAPDDGTNTVLTSHGYNIEAVADVTTAEGDGYVFRPEAAGSYVLVATITPDGWGELADQFGGNGG
jgi:phosphohistidine phosphatase SixA